MKKDTVWAFLAHLGYNMWADPAVNARGIRAMKENTGSILAEDSLRFDTDLWHRVRDALAKAGCNMIVLDIGEGMQYESHPELSCKNAVSKEFLRAEAEACRALGIELIPKLNFSACHDEWLGEYSRMVSTSAYYKVCSDVIAEVCETFGSPRWFHLGMDEENLPNQRYYNYVVIRQGEQWWYDFNFLVKETMKNGARPWIWSDKIRAEKEDFLTNMSREVIQSEWYYGEGTSPDFDRWAGWFSDLGNAGFDQLPTGSVWATEKNFPRLVAQTKDILPEEHLLGYFQTVWHPMLPEFEKMQFLGVDTLGEAVRASGR